MTTTLNWLKSRLITGNNGIVFDNDINNTSKNFDAIQSFVESVDLPVKTPVIYYEAFPEERAVDFLNTLKEELASKLELKSQSTLTSIIEAAKLNMIIIDKCHLHPQDTLQELLSFFASCNVAVILVGSKDKMAISQIFSHPTVSGWEKLASCDKCEAI